MKTQNQSILDRPCYFKHARLAALLFGSAFISVNHLCSAAPASSFADIMGPWEVPSHVRAIVQTDKTTYFVGENVTLYLFIENKGPSAIHFSSGGDYRGGSRADRFRVQAFNAAGQSMPDPEPLQMNMGGLGGGGVINPGEKKEIDIGGIPFNRYRMIEKAGTYRVIVSHDLGWKETATKKIPAAETTITFVEPSVEQARKLIESMKDQPNVMDSRRFFGKQAWADWETIRYPAYLPALKDWAIHGSSWAVIGIGSIETPEATNALIGLLDGAAVAVVAGSLEQIDSRVPAVHRSFGDEKKYPAFKLARERTESKIAHCWRDSFSDQLRPKLFREIEKGDDERPRLALIALAPLLREMDRAFLVKQFDRFLDANSKIVGWSDFGNTPGQLSPDQLAELQRKGALLQNLESWKAAMTSYAEKSYAVPGAPSTAAEKFLFLAALKARTEYRPTGWEQQCAALTSANSPVVRMKAAEVCGSLVASKSASDLTRLLADPDPDVQLAAITEASKKVDPKLTGPVLLALAHTSDWRFVSPAVGYAIKAGKRYDAVETLANRLDASEIDFRPRGMAPFRYLTEV